MDLREENQRLKGEIAALRRRVAELEAKEEFLPVRSSEAGPPLDLRDILQFAIDQSPSLVFISDLEGHISYVNKSVIQRSGFSREELIGNFSNKLRVPGDSDDRMWALWDTITAGEVWKGEFLNQTKSGETYWVEAVISPIQNKGQIVSYLMYQTEISERKALEKLKQHNEKLRSLSIFAGVISHDFKNTLSVITLATSVLRQQIGPEEESEIIFDEIDHSIELATSLSNQLIAQAKGTNQDVMPLNLPQMLLEMKPLLLRTAGQNIDLSMHIRDSNLWINGNQVLINQAIVNLVANAAEAIETHGAIEVSLDRLYRSNGSFSCSCKVTHIHFVTPLENIASRSTEYAVIHVTDTGSGLAESDLDTIFNSFYTTKKTGTGLGLSSVYGTIYGLNGFIGISSRQGVGTVFHIFIPAIQFA